MLSSLFYALLPPIYIIFLNITEPFLEEEIGQVYLVVTYAFTSFLMTLVYIT